jgi:hypothetical protein
MHLDADETRGIYGLARKSDADPEVDLLFALAFATFLQRAQRSISVADSLGSLHSGPMAEAYGVPLDLAGDDTVVDLHREEVAECGPILKT